MPLMQIIVPPCCWTRSRLVKDVIYRMRKAVGSDPAIINVGHRVPSAADIHS